MSKIRNKRTNPRMMKGGDPYSDYYNNNGGIYDPGAVSCYGECHPNEAPCEPGCMCTGGGSGNNWWGTCTSEADAGGSLTVGCCPCPGGACLPGCCLKSMMEHFVLGQGGGEWTKTEFLNEYARNPEWQSIARQKGWDNAPTGSIYCLLCCFMASCCDGCTRCPCTDDKEAY